MHRDDASPSDGPLRSARLVLRPWRDADAVVHRELWTERDPRVPAHRRIDAEGHPTVEELAAWSRRTRQAPTPGLLVVERRDTGAMIGYAGLVPNSVGQPDEPELAYELLRSAWGNGYATEAGAIVVAEATRNGHTRLASTVRAWNTASLRVLEKLGFSITDEVEPDPVHGDSLLLRRIA